MLLLAKYRNPTTNLLSGKRKKQTGKKRNPSPSDAPTLTKVVNINPFAGWTMPQTPGGYIKGREKDCF
ncbi:hypothetical protein [Flavihumibacter solisilvae]|uniref:Uncharacterized protein n=1 Tax=Flavihumibacter solisilvae TaxID=1349421 RepID=A0A0C1LLR5_9BACT|nr:hypothetical protein [Flavihumibacter solisilvae]KIC96288.1 hypothetical protein OI18_00545 [Flavihumibacter solisilvae]